MEVKYSGLCQCGCTLLRQPHQHPPGGAICEGYIINAWERVFEKADLGFVIGDGADTIQQSFKDVPGGVVWTCVEDGTRETAIEVCGDDVRVLKRRELVAKGASDGN